MYEFGFYTVVLVFDVTVLIEFDMTSIVAIGNQLGLVPPNIA